MRRQRQCGRVTGSKPRRLALREPTAGAGIRFIQARAARPRLVSPHDRSHREIWIRDLDGYLVVFAEPYDTAPVRR